MPKLRSQIAKKYLWDLSPLYASNKEYETDLIVAVKLLQSIKKFKGHLRNAQTLSRFLPLYEKFMQTYENLAVFAFMDFSVDTSSHFHRERLQKLEHSSAHWLSELVFVEQELSRITKKELAGFLKVKKGLQKYKYFLETFARYAPHLLDESTEQALSSLEPVLGRSENIFETFNNTNLKFPPVLHQGKKIEVTHGNSSELLESNDSELRKKVHTSLYTPYLEMKDTLASIYEGTVLNNSIKKRLRQFKSALAGTLFLNEIDPKVYETVVAAARKYVKLQHKLHNLRKKHLKVSKLHSADLSIPLIKTDSVKFDYDEIVATTRASLQPLGENYILLYENALNSRVVDVMESAYKRSGAYSYGSYRSRGFLLLNQTGKSRDISTFTHEMGHCLHRDFSISAQPFFYYNNPIILAEVASIANEIFLYEYLLANEKNQQRKKYFIYQYIRLIEGSFFRQTMYADFEMQAHALADLGQPLSQRTLCEIYEQLLKKYHGPEVKFNEEKKMEWARIPHFHHPFYVFKYATAIACAMHFAQRILSEEKGAVDDYLKFLRAGSHKPPLEILKDSGIDLTKIDTYSPLMKKLSELINELA